MIQPFNPYFVGREEYLSDFQHLLRECDDQLVILSIEGPGGIGKTWLQEEFRSMCADAAIPFAYLNPRDVSDDPVSLLTGFACRMGLGSDWVEKANDRTFSQLMPRFMMALCAVDAPVVMLMLDNYDQMTHFDYRVRDLIRHLAQQGSPHGSQSGVVTNSSNRSEGLPRFIVVISSKMSLREYWPLNPIYQRPLQTIELKDFTCSETYDYLDRMEIPQEHQADLYRRTGGYPLALALAAMLKSWPGDKDGGDQELIPQQDWEKFLQETLERALRVLNGDQLRPQVIEALHAAATVRRFSRELLEVMLNRPRLPDVLFDRVTALSMVVERKQRPGRSDTPRTFILHNALRKALLEDARRRGLENVVNEYRRRASAYYVIQQEVMKQEDAIAQRALDIIFLNKAPFVHGLFFDEPSTSLLIGSASLGELDEALESLMQENPLYQQMDFKGQPLAQLIQQTRDWLALDWDMHGEMLHYFQVARRRGGRGDIAGFVLNVHVSEETLPLLRRDTIGAVYETGVRTIEVPTDRKCVFSLRMVIDKWDCQSTLVRAIFVQLIREAFDILVIVTPWESITQLMTQLGADALARDVEYKGYSYDVVRLDVARYGGAMQWLQHLVRQGMGLTPSDWEHYTCQIRNLIQQRIALGASISDWKECVKQVREALQQLWGDIATLSQCKLIRTLDLAAPTDAAPVRVERLHHAISEAHARLRPSDEEKAKLRERGEIAHYTILNRLYGIAGKPRRRFKLGEHRPPQKTIAELLGVGWPQPFCKLRDAAIERLAEELWTVSGNIKKS